MGRKKWWKSDEKKNDEKSIKKKMKEWWQSNEKLNSGVHIIKIKKPTEELN